MLFDGHQAEVVAVQVDPHEQVTRSKHAEVPNVIEEQGLAVVVPRTDGVKVEATHAEQVVVTLDVYAKGPAVSVELSGGNVALQPQADSNCPILQPDGCWNKVVLSLDEHPSC